jgi:ferritin-like metal-binding protein YciE
MALNSLHDLYVEELKDLYDAENQILKALPKMVKAATSTELQEAFQEHLEQTQEHARRLEGIFEKLKLRGKGKKCKAMEGLLAEGKEIMKEDGEDMVKDAGLIAAAQRVEHYEMAGYGCARTFALLLGEEESAQLLQQTLGEEEAADQKLTEVAESTINPGAASIADESE